MNDDDYLRAIRENIDDDGPRLVYADVLQERGDPRGELIVVQCERSRLEREGKQLTPRFRALLQRERQILDQHVKSWVNPYGLRGWWGDFERGFITKLNVSAAALRSKWPLYRSLPLEEITIRHQRGGLPPLGALAWLGAEELSARKLSIDAGLGRASFHMPAAQMALKNATSSETPIWSGPLPNAQLLPGLCDLSINYPTNDHLVALARTLVPLRTFRFNLGTPLGAPEMRALVESPSFVAVEDLWAGFVGDDAASGIFSARRLPALHTLGVTRVDRTPFPAAVGAAFARASFLEQLTSFRSDLVLDGAVVRAIIDRMPSLQHLTLERAVAHPAALTTLLASDVPERLRTVSLTGNADTPVSLVTQAHFPHLEVLQLQGFTLGHADVAALPNVPLFHAFDCRYEDGVQDAIRARWPFARTT